MNTQVNTLIEDRKEWQGVQLTKRKFTPKPCIISEDQVPQSIHNRPNIQARHFQKIFTPITTKTPLTSTPIHPTDTTFNLEPFTILELEEAMAQLKPSKAPGPDDIQNELLKFLDENNMQVILNHINTAFQTQVIPNQWKHAYIAAIYKKDDPAEPGNYRPIALLCTMYKLYSRMLQARLADKMEPKFRNRQYGFRKNKSGSNPIHIVRRIQELYEVSTSPLYMLFLDWKNAFDKLTFEYLFYLFFLQCFLDFMH
jgi:hypothetical protein